MTPKLPASPPHAGHRCGTTAVRRNHRNRARVLRLSRTGIWQTNHRPTIPTISARNGEPEKGGRDDCAGVGLYPWVARCVVWDDGAQILADSDGQFRGNPVFREGLGCDTWAHAVGVPIRLCKNEMLEGFSMLTPPSSSKASRMLPTCSSEPSTGGGECIEVAVAAMASLAFGFKTAPVRICAPSYQNSSYDGNSSVPFAKHHSPGE